MKKHAETLQNKTKQTANKHRTIPKASGQGGESKRALNYNFCLYPECKYSHCCF